MNGQIDRVPFNQESLKFPDLRVPYLALRHSFNYQQYMTPFASSVHRYWRLVLGNAADALSRRPEGSDHVDRISRADGEWSTAIAEELTDLLRCLR
jgi:hypothetical protein